MTYKFILLSMLFSCMFGIISCESKDYATLKKEGIASGKLNKDILFDLKFGDTNPQFFEKCLKLNQEGNNHKWS